MIYEDCEVHTLSEPDGTQNITRKKPANDNKDGMV